MENVYEIRRNNNLNMILSDKIKDNPDTVIEKKQMAVIVHLHYSDTVDFFMEKLKNVPKVVDIYISTSEKKTRAKIVAGIEKHHLMNCRIVDKENRGRDISALLVACKGIVKEYEYFCFLHDKKGKHQYDQEYKWEWCISMWNNMIASENYIYNVKNIFDQQKRIGVLAVPEPFYVQYIPAFNGGWYKNYHKTKELAERLQLNCNIELQMPVITLGSVFWCRKAALDKLLEFPWEYEDFDEEPMANDGTISHAVERIFAYVAQDAGYMTGNIRTVQYAEKNIEDMQYYLSVAFKHLEKRLKIWNFDNLVHYEERKKRCTEFVNKYKDIYVYGAGAGGRHCLCMLKEIGVVPKAVLVTQKKVDESDFYGIPLVEFEASQVGENVGILVAVDAKYKSEIIANLNKAGIENYMWLLGKQQEEIGV